MCDRACRCGAEIEVLKDRLADALAREQVECEGTQQCQGCADCRKDWVKKLSTARSRIRANLDEKDAEVKWLREQIRLTNIDAAEAEIEANRLRREQKRDALDGQNALDERDAEIVQLRRERDDARRERDTVGAEVALLRGHGKAMFVAGYEAGRASVTAAKEEE